LKKSSMAWSKREWRRGDGLGEKGKKREGRTLSRRERSMRKLMSMALDGKQNVIEFHIERGEREGKKNKKELRKKRSE